MSEERRLLLDRRAPLVLLLLRNKVAANISCTVALECNGQRCVAYTLDNAAAEHWMFYEVPDPVSGLIGLH